VVSVVSKARDTVSALCFEHYGTTQGGVVEAVLEENPHLFNFGVLLPAGVIIDFPVVRERKPAADERFHLWDYVGS